MEDPTRFQDLIDKYLDENLQPQEREELEQRLLQSESARQVFWELTEVHGLLRETLTTQPGTAATDAAVIQFKRANQLRKWTIAAASIAAGLLLLATWKVFQVGEPSQPEIQKAAQPHQYLAKIGFQSQEVRQSGKFQPRQFLKTGQLELEAGLLELVFFNNVTVLLQGPAKVRLDSLQHMVLHHGQFTAEVPEGAEGFTVSTPLGEVIDLGTQFGVSVNADGNVEAHVFQGEVEVSRHGTKRKLHEAQALRLAPGGSRDLPAAPTSFPALRTTLDMELPYGGFETDTLVEIGNWPTGIGNWSGDRARTVGADQGIQPQAGMAMLRFEHTYNDSEMFQPETNYFVSTQQQFIDITEIRQAHPDARLTAEVTAYFNRVDAGPDTDSMFTLGIRAFAGSPGNLPPSDRNLEANRQASIENTLLSDADPATWQPLSTKINIPRHANLLLVQVGASENERNDPHEAQELDGHYVDSVSLQFHRSPIPGRH